MKRETQTVWFADTGEELLRHKTGEEFYTPMGTMVPSQMRQLRDALTDALADPLVQAANESKRVNGGQAT